MARPTGRRFSDREETQKGSTNSRAVTKEGLTNKNDRMPSGRADFIEDVKRDLDIIQREDRPATGAARASQEAAKNRATTRQYGRAGAIGTAVYTGYGIGRSLGEAGLDDVVRKGIDKSGLGDVIDKSATGERVTLTKEARERIRAGELDKDKDERVNKEDYPTYKKDTKSAEAFRKEYREAKKEGKDSFNFEGRKYSTDSKEEENEYARGGLAKKMAYAKGGMVNKVVYANCGASVPPAQKGKK